MSSLVAIITARGRGDRIFPGLRLCCALLFFVFSLMPAYGQDAQKGGDGKLVLDLKQCIKKAVDLSPEIGESRYDVEVYSAKKMQADSAAYPQVELLALSGPSPKARSEQLLATNYSSINLNGIFGSIDAILIQPLYTFGKISSYQEAASGGIKVARAGVDKKTSEIALRTKELYYGILLARTLKSLVLEIRDDLVDSIKRAEKQFEEGAASADETNFYKLKGFLGVADKSLNEAEKGEALAKDALMTSMGIPRGTDFDIADTTLTPVDKVPDDVATYMRLSLELRPEFIQLKEGLVAKNALVNVEKSSFYPQLFLGAMGSLSGASNRERINNPYIPDLFNHSYAAAFVGIQLGLDFGIRDGKVREAKAEYYKIVEKKKFADEAIPFQVRKAYMDMAEAKKNIAETEEGYKNARKWLVAAVANFDMGLGDAKDIGDAAALYAQTKTDYIRALYNHRLSYANLLYAAGLDLKEIR